MRSPIRLMFPLGLALAACGGQPAPSPETRPAAEAGPAHPHGHHHAPHHQHRFDDVEKWARLWDDGERDAWQKPDAVIAALALPPDALVADVGAGTGYFAIPLARAVPQGRVYAADIEPNMVEHLRHRAAQAGLTNLEAVLSTPDDPRLPTPVDVLFLCNTYHHIEGRDAWFRRVRASLKPGGRLVVVDYRKDWDGPGPPPEMRLAADVVESEMRAAGWRPVSRDEQTLPRQYMLTFAPAD